MTFEEYKGNGYPGWNLPKAINEVELREVINRIYDDKLTEEMLAPKFRFELLRLLLPSCPKKTLASAKKNYSGYKDTNIIYHLLKVVPQLFIASLHYSDYGRYGMTHNLDKLPPHTERHLYHTRLEKVIGLHLEERDELHKQIENLEEGKGYMLESEHIREIKELKEKHKQELEDETYRVAKKKEMERVELEREVSDLKHQIKMLLWDMKCSGVKPSKAMNELPPDTNETNESCLPSTEQEGLDEIYKQ